MSAVYRIEEKKCATCRWWNGERGIEFRANKPFYVKVGNSNSTCIAKSNGPASAATTCPSGRGGKRFNQRKDYEMGWLNDLFSNPMLIDKAGLHFNEHPVEIHWSDITKIHINDGHASFCLRDVLFSVDADDIDWDDHICVLVGRPDGELKYEYNGQVDLSRIAHCQTKSIFDVDIFHGDRADLSTACQDVLWSMEMVDSLRDVSDVSLDERNLLAACYNAYLATMGWEIASDELLPYEDKLGLSYKIKAQLERSEDVVEDALLGKVFAHARMVDASIEMQARLYDNLRNAKLFGYKFENDEIVDVLRADENGYEAFGGKEWAKRRKMIICTDEKASLDTWKDGLQIPNVMVMDAQDIHDYNDAMSEELKLKFETNHPQNGVTYVQHPMRQNVYIDLKLFHASMLEQKYNELRYFLISLGATEVICEVESNSSSDEKLRRRNSGKAGVDTLVGGGQVDFDRSIASSKTIDIKKRLASKFVGPGGKPHIPEKMLFYPFEDSWQHLAKMVMEGRVREYDVRLTYSKDFALTGQTLTSVGAKVRSKVPGYQFGVEGSFSAEFDNELKQLQSTAWHYYAKFGNGDNETGRGQAQSAQSSDAVAVHKEETADTADSSKKWDKALSIGETIISIAKRMREGQIK